MFAIIEADLAYGRFIIYGLRDTRPERMGELRYIGRSASGLRRPRQHQRPSALGKRTHLSCWLGTLANLGLKPEISVLQVCASEEELNDTEVYWISQVRNCGVPLVNGTDGGGGMVGYVPTEETRQKTRRSSTGRRHSPETIAKISAAKRGKKFTEEHRRNLSIAHKGQKPTPEIIEKRRQTRASRVFHHSPEARAKMSEKALGRKNSPETRAKMSKAHKGKRLSQETIRKIVEKKLTKRAAENADAMEVAS